MYIHVSYWSYSYLKLICIKRKSEKSCVWQKHQVSILSCYIKISPVNLFLLNGLKSNHLNLHMRIAAQSIIWYKSENQIHLLTFSSLFHFILFAFSQEALQFIKFRWEIIKHNIQNVFTPYCSQTWNRIFIGWKVW